MCKYDEPYGKLFSYTVEGQTELCEIIWKRSKFVRNLRVFGKVGVVTMGKKIKSKLENRGITCLFVV